MSKFYINDNNGRKYYVYKYQNDEVKYFRLNSLDISKLLTSIVKDNISSIYDKDQYMEITFESGFSLIIDNLNIFALHQDNNDSYFQELLQKLKEFTEQKAIKKYKSSLPPNHIPKVNRTKKKSMPTKRIIAGALSFALSASLIAGSINKKSAKTDEQNSENISITQTLPSNEFITYSPEPSSSLNKENIANNDSIKVSLAFKDETESGKLEQTKELCSPYLEHWIERYGLPRDLIYALVSQESGLLDCTVNSLGSCGPMQLQVSSFHNENNIEYMKVAVYKDGKPTGEYDEFYVADERHLDDPRLEGKNYLVMQNLEDNFQIGCAQVQRCIERYKNIFLAVDAYNKGLYAFTNCCDDSTLNYYQEHFEDFSWTNIIPEHFGESYGDKDYIWHVLRYLDTSTRGEANIEYNYQGQLIVVDLTNTNVYNSELSR